MGKKTARRIIAEHFNDYTKIFCSRTNKSPENSASRFGKTRQEHFLIKVHFDIIYETPDKSCVFIANFVKTAFYLRNKNNVKKQLYLPDRFRSGRMSFLAI